MEDTAKMRTSAQWDQDLHQYVKTSTLSDDRPVMTGEFLKDQDMYAYCRAFCNAVGMPISKLTYTNDTYFSYVVPRLTVPYTRSFSNSYGYEYYTSANTPVYKATPANRACMIPCTA